MGIFLSMTGLDRFADRLRDWLDSGKRYEFRAEITWLQKMTQNL